MKTILVTSTLALLIGGCGDPSEREPQPPPPRAPEPGERFESIDPPAADGSIGLNPIPDGEDVVATWIEPVSEEVHRVRFATLRGSTGRWSDASTIVESERVLANSVDFPTVVRAEDGGLYATWLRAGTAPHAAHVHVASSPDGATWHQLGPLHDDGTETEHGHTSLFREGPLVRAVWLDGRASVDGGPTSLRSAVISQGRVGDSDVLDPRVCDCCQTAAIGTPDGVFVAYRDRSATERRDIAILRRQHDQWTQPQPLHVDGWTFRGCPVNGPQVDARGRDLVVAWYTAPDEGASVRVAFSHDAGATFARPLEIDPGAPAGRVDVIWIGADSALVAWLGADADGGPLRVRLRRVSRDRRLGAIVDVAALGATQAVGVPRLANWGRRAVIAWTEAGAPRRVRARVFTPLDLPEPTGSATPGPAAVAAARMQPGTPLPDVEVARIDGPAPLGLGMLRGTPTVVSFFASWCAPCRDEFPILSRLAREHGDALHVVGISIDEGPTSRVAAFAREHALTYVVAHDLDGSAAAAFGVPPIPATFVFDARGELTHRYVGGGPETLEALPGAVAEALRSAAEEHPAHGGHGHPH